MCDNCSFFKEHAMWIKQQGTILKNSVEAQFPAISIADIKNKYYNL